MSDVFIKYCAAIREIMRDIQSAYENEEYEKVGELLAVRNTKIEMMVKAAEESDKENAFRVLTEVKQLDSQIRALVSSQVDDLAHSIHSLGQLKAYLGV